MPKLPPRKPKPAPPSEEWVAREVELWLETEHPIHKTVKTQAKCKGHVAVHKATDGTPRWSVSVIPAQVRLITVKTQDSALQIAEVVHATVANIISTPDYEELRSLLEYHEPWFKLWLMECKAVGAYTEPKL